MPWPLGGWCLLGVMSEVHGQGLDSADLEMRLHARLRRVYFVLLPFGSHMSLKNSTIDVLLKVTFWGAGACEQDMRGSGDQTPAAFRVPGSAASFLHGLFLSLDGPQYDVCLFAILFAFRTWSA